MASRIPGVGLVTVSLRKSTIMPRSLPLVRRDGQRGAPRHAFGAGENARPRLLSYLEGMGKTNGLFVLALLGCNAPALPVPLYVTERSLDGTWSFGLALDHHFLYWTEGRAGVGPTRVGRVPRAGGV